MKLVTDRTNFRKLLESVGFRGIGDWKRFEVEIIGDTMFFIRWNFNNAYMVDEREGKGPAYGYSTPQELTAYDKEFEGSTPHHRILEHNLGGMKCFVRFEVDAVIEEKGNEPVVNYAVKEASPANANIGNQSDGSSDQMSHTDLDISVDLDLPLKGLNVG